MSAWSRFRSWLQLAANRSAVDRAQLDEWQFHIEQRAADLERQGVVSSEALRRARAEFGSLDARREESRDAVGLRVFDDLCADLRYAFRLLRQSPAFTAVAVLSLGLGIGANSAMFSLMEAVLWKSLPVPAPDQLRQVAWVSGPKEVMSSMWGNDSPTPAGGVTSTSMSYPVFVAMQGAAESQGAHLSAFKPIGRLTAVIGGKAELVNCDLVSGDFYQSIRVSPAVGRAIVPADDRRNADGTVAVISDAFWARRFGRDRSILSQTIQINQVPVTIVGVNASAFTGFTAGRLPDVFLPITAQPALLPLRPSETVAMIDDPNFWWVLTMARVPEGIDEARLQRAMDVAMGDQVRPLLEANPGSDRPHVRLTSGGRGVDDLRDEFSRPLIVLTAFVGLVLLIACANLANLLLARAVSRQREVSLRLALGAGSWRIARQMLTEGLVLASLGGTLGVLLGFWLRNGIPHLLGTSWEPIPLQADFSLRVLALSGALTIGTGVLFSLAPMWQAARVRVAAALKDGGRATGGRSRRVARRSLVVVQVALSVVLLIGAGLFLRTLWNLRTADLGFQPERLVLFTIDPPRNRYSGPARTDLFARIEQGIARLPGVQSATLTTEALVASSSSTTRATPIGRASRGQADRTWVNEVGWDFFKTMEIPILYGRGFAPRDRAGAPLVAVVNQAFVRNFYPGTNPVGQTFSSRGGRAIYQIIGVSGDARYHRINAPMPPTFYRPYAQEGDLRSMTFEVRTMLQPAVLVNMARGVVDGIDRELPIFDVRTQVEQIDATLSQQRTFAALTTAFGLLAVILASIGIYGVIAGSVASRVPEIGVRMALGAERRQVLMMVLREAATLGLLGVVTGVSAAAVLVKYIASFLYNLTPFDPITAGSATLLMLAVALVSGWWPARFASRLDPMQALRHE
jgi:predicted permease